MTTTNATTNATTNTNTNTNATPTLTARVYVAGTLIVGGRSLSRGGVDYSGALAAYQFATPGDLYRVASRHAFVQRLRYAPVPERLGGSPGDTHLVERETIAGGAYTLRKATNDWRALSYSA